MEMKRLPAKGPQVFKRPREYGLKTGNRISSQDELNETD